MSLFRFILFNLKIFSEIVSTQNVTIYTMLVVNQYVFAQKKGGPNNTICHN